MHYEINVSKLNKKDGEYYHLFATHKRSCDSTIATVRVLRTFLKLFPSPEYSIDLTKWEETGQGVNKERFLNDNIKVQD